MDPRARVDTSGQGQAATSAREVVASFRAGDDGLLGVLLCTELPQHFPSKGFAKRTLARKQCLVIIRPSCEVNSLLRFSSICHEIAGGSKT